MKRSLRSFRSGLVVSALVAVLALAAAAVAPFAAFAASSAALVNQEVVAQNGIVASATPESSEVGVATLKAGGNAVDAAVAAAFALGVTEPNASGLGGEGMMVVYLAKTDETVAIDYRSVAPKAASPSLWPDRFPGSGWQAVAIPGTVAGLTLALERYGTMSLAQVLEPAIELAEKGFPVSEALAGIIADNFKAIQADPELASIYLKDGFPPLAGDILTNPKLAATYRILAEKGSDAFYRGPIADAIVKASTTGKGIITAADLADYKALERIPAEGSYRGYRIVSAPAPVAGPTVIETLQILNNYELGPEFLSTRTVHLVSEALKRAYADFSQYIGDPAYFDVPERGLVSQAYADARAADIPLDKMGPRPKAGNPAAYEPQNSTFLRPAGLTVADGVPAAATLPHESPSTTHLSALDKDGNLVALTQTVSSFFGAKVAVPGTGIIMNNEMQNWSRPESSPNKLEGGKRVRTTIAPTLIFTPDGKPWVSLGTPGAGRIASTVVEMIVNLVDYRASIQEAIEAPRFYARDSEKNVAVESRFPANLQDALKAMGYSLSVRGDYDLFFGGAQGILIDPETGLLHGGADPRRSGGVVGY